MNPLWLTDEQAQQIMTHVRAEAPNEACGLIAGQGSQAMKILPVPNRASDPLHYYEMDRAALSHHLPSLAKDGLDLIGMYHSHPRSEPFPSPEDIRKAYYPNTAYLIVGLKHPEPHFAAWLIDQGRVKPLPLHIGRLPPSDIESGAEPLSSKEKIAVILSGLLAVLLLVVLSLSLLPPAPPIPN